MADDAMNTPLDPTLAAQLGIPYDAANPPTMQAVLQRQMVGVMNGLSSMSAKNQEMVEDFQDRISGRKKSTLQPEQQVKVQQLSEVFEKYPELINPTFLFAATLMRRMLDQRKYLSAQPGRELELMDAIETLLKEKVPPELWPNPPAQPQSAAA